MVGGSNPISIAVGILTVPNKGAWVVGGFLDYLKLCFFLQNLALQSITAVGVLGHFYFLGKPICPSASYIVLVTSKGCNFAFFVKLINISVIELQVSFDHHAVAHLNLVTGGEIITIHKIAIKYIQLCVCGAII